MKFILEIDTDNAAFEADGKVLSDADHAWARHREVARILRVAADHVTNGTDWPLFDSNGNTVGHYTYTNDD